MCDNRFFLDHREQFTAAFQLDEVVDGPAFGDCIGGIVAVVPLPTFGKRGTFVLPDRLAFEHIQFDESDRGSADFAQLLGNDFHAAFAAVVVVRPQQHIPTFESC